MCVSPITIKNPNYIKGSFRSNEGQLISTDPRLYSHKRYIDVPCGKCPECRNTYFNSLLQRCIVEARSSYMYFVTLTYDNAHIPCVNVGGKNIFFSDYQHIQNLFKRIRRHQVLDREFRYISVNEYGDSRHRPHIHLLIFVAKRFNDSRSIPYDIEKVLFTNLAKYFAINKGSLKFPVYERLFTYRIRHTSQGIKTNYFVKYVETSVPGTFSPEISNTLVKTIRYLIGYMNKSSRFDKFISDYLEFYRVSDPIMWKKLSSLLRNKVRYSKGLGFGFIDGLKHYLSPTYVHMSKNTMYYTDLVSSLPSNFTEFSEQYPTLAEDTLYFIERDIYHYVRDVNSLSKVMDTLADSYFYDAEQYKYKLIILAIKYFPKEVNRICRDYFYNSHLSTATISYFFNFLHEDYSYKVNNCKTFSPFYDSPVYQFIRENISQGLKNRVPFLTFLIPGSTPSFQPLCSFYKRCCTNMNDILNMYDSIGCANYDEWQEQFTHYVSNQARKADITKANDFRYSLSEDIICISQNIDLPLSPETTNMYNVIFGTSIIH